MSNLVFHLRILFLSVLLSSEGFGKYTCSQIFIEDGWQNMVDMKKKIEVFKEGIKIYFDSSENKKILSASETLTIYLASENDVINVMKLIHLAFEVWKKKGLDLSPMQQSESQTSKHLLSKGIVIKNAKNEIILSVSFDIAYIQTTKSIYYFFEGEEAAVPYKRISDFNHKKSSFLVLKKFAVHPKYSNRGLGKTILYIVEKMALEFKLDGILLETVIEADWLFEWYSNEGFQTIGKYSYPNRPLETVLMLKTFENGDYK